MKTIISKQEHIQPIIEKLKSLKFDQNQIYRFELVKPRNKRTTLQNSSLHKYFDLLCEALNDAGYTFNVAMAHRSLAILEDFTDWIDDKYGARTDRGAKLLCWVQLIRKSLLHADINWNQELVKNRLWRPAQIAATGKQSSTDLSTVEIQEVFDEFNRFTAQVWGISIPWPSIDSLSESQRQIT